MFSGDGGRSYRRFILNTVLFITIMLIVNSWLLYSNMNRLFINENGQKQLGYLEMLNKQINMKLDELLTANNLVSDFISTSGILERLRDNGTDQYGFNQIFMEFSRRITYYLSFTSVSTQFIIHSPGYSFLFSDYSTDRTGYSNGTKLEDFSIYRDMSEKRSNLSFITSAPQKEELIKSFLTSGNSAESGTSYSGNNLSNVILVAVRKTTMSNTPFIVVSQINLNSIVGLDGYLDKKNLLIVNNNEDLYRGQSLKGIGSKELGRIAGQELTGSFSAVCGGKKGLMFFVKDEYCGITTCCFIPDDVYNSSSNGLLLLLIIMCAASIAFMAFINMFYSGRYILKPLQSLSAATQNGREAEVPGKWDTSYRFPSISMRNKSLAVFTLAFLVPNCILMWFCYAFSSRVLENSRIDYVDAAANHIAEDMDSLVHNYENLIKYLIFRDEIQTTMNMGKLPITQEQKDLITSAILENPFGIKGVSNIRIYDDKGKLAYSLMERNTDGYQENLYTRLPGLSKLDLKTLSDWTFLKEESQNGIICLTREIRRYSINSQVGNEPKEYEKTGYLCVDIQESAISGIYNNTATQFNGIAVVNQDGMVVSGSNSKYNGKAFQIFTDGTFENIDGSNRRIIEKMVPSNKWDIMVLMDFGEIKNAVENNILQSFYIVFILLFCMLFLIIAFIYRMVMPIERLDNDIRHISEKDGVLTTIRESVFGYDEINNLSRSFNLMIERINHLICTVYMSEVRRTNVEKKKKEAELNALQAQINPHFIYNTLESINWMIKLGRNKEATQMVKLFSNLLHMGVDRKNLCVSLEEELRHVEAYIGIQQIRYKDRLVFCNQMPREILKYRTLKLLLQPLVENAVMHGMQVKKGVLTVIINAYANDSDIIVNVIDDGVGISRDRLKNVNENIISESNESIGIKNVHDRIQMYFGNQYYLKLSSIYGGGTTITLCIPKIEGDYIIRE